MNNIVGITSIGCYIPYYFMQRSTIARAWGAKGQKGTKSIGNSDEDSITMAVEAAYECFRFVDKDKIDSMFYASTTAPYTEKNNSTLISTACNLRSEIHSADFAHSMRASISALRAAYNEVSTGNSKNVLMTAADIRMGYPKSSQEQSLGDGAAALVIGNEDVIAIIDCFSSCNNEIVDMWRNRNDKFVRNAETRFALEEGYLSSMSEVIKDILQKSNLAIDVFSKVILSTQGPKDYVKLTKEFGISSVQLQENFMTEVGNTGVAQPIMMLVDALENSKPGDRILLAAYGNGADAMIFTVTENVSKINGANSIRKYIDNRAEFNDYGRFLSFREIIEANPGEDFKIPASTAMTWREQKTYLKLNASHCDTCGLEIFPINRICPECMSKDQYHLVNKTEEITTLFNYSIDNLAGRSDDPVIVQCIAEDTNGTRYYMNMTDYKADVVDIEMVMEFTFRKIHNLGDFGNYYWKLRPLRRKLVKS